MPEPRPRKQREPYIAPTRSSRLYLRLAPRHLALCKFLLEGAGHLGYLSVVDRHAAVAKLTFSPDTAREVAAFLDQIREAVPHQVVFAGE